MTAIQLVADIGSTFTKGFAVDPSGALAWSGTVATQADDLASTEAALRAAMRDDGLRVDDAVISACSSAAGGLRVVALGLTPGLTFEAARKAALGAGARIVAGFAGGLTDADLQAITAARPDIILLTGGTDGGEGKAAPGFAARLAELRDPVRVVVACNRFVAENCRRILESAGHEPVITPNVLPEVGRLELDQARAVIREIFATAVIGRLEGPVPHGFNILLPTPRAVLQAAALLHDLWGADALMVVDAGGATTDVHSILSGSLLAGRIDSAAGFEPVASRTVEADLGMRESAPAAVEAARRDGRALPPAPAGIESAAALRARHVTFLPDRYDPAEEWLARVVVQVALERHVGRLVPALSGSRLQLLPVGRDLRHAKVVVGTGGALARRNATTALRAALAETAADILTPRDALVVRDASYVLACVGVLTVRHRVRAERLVLHEFAAPLNLSTGPVGGPVSAFDVDERERTRG